MGGAYGPGGVDEGSGCVLRWNIDSNGSVVSVGSDSGQLRGITNSAVSYLPNPPPFMSSSEIL